ncbi:ABC transporter substrate-binding protein [Acidisoma cladoniae]|jgi:branched-chain amino acid transport system substrate-binding protein|uniref:ABC transporter substrate-binding protein n=1 Tax=Acidisoma cladoniae TaxID=3040935 RepID=UPI00254B9C5A|nr:ABC transporter substrate-binding protein [Acidisoma sp. PAMC 29798]
MRIRGRLRATLMGALSAAMAATAWPAQGQAAGNDIVVGFAVALSGGLNSVDGDATKMAQLWIDQTNAHGGLLGRQIKSVYADTKTDRVEGARAGLKVLGEGAQLVFVTADYDYGAPAALQAQKAGKMSVFLGASDAKAGVIGVGPYSFTAEKVAQLEGAMMAEWGYEKKGYRRAYVLEDSSIEYDKSTCAGFQWAFPKEGGTIIGTDTFKNDDPSISSQVTRISNAVRDHKVDALMLCTYNPGGSSAIRQIRDGGVTLPILSGSSMDGTYWIDAVPGLKDFYLPVEAVVSGDPRPAVQQLTAEYAAKYGKAPSSQYAYPIYAWLQLWAKAVTTAGTTDAKAVSAIMQTYTDQPTVLGPRSFTPRMHIQTNIPMTIVDIAGGKQIAITQWQVKAPIPLAVIYRLKKAP